MPNHSAQPYRLPTPIRRSLRRQWLFLCILCTSGILIIALGAQLFKIYQNVGDILDPSSFVALLSQGIFILLEMVVPIGVLAGTALLFSKLRTQRIPLAIATLGYRPEEMLRPMVPLAIVTSAMCIWCSTSPIPSTIERFGQTLHRLFVSAALEKEGVVQMNGARLHTVKLATGNKQHWVLIHRPSQPAVIMYGENLALSTAGSEWTMTADALMMWPQAFQITAESATFSFDRPSLPAQLRMFGPPNAYSNAQLNLTNPHHAFTYHRRLAFGFIIVPWFIIGAFAAIRFSGPLVGLLCSGLIGMSYWVLRSGELAARAHEYPPILAAWGPVILASGLLMFLWLRVRQGTV